MNRLEKITKVFKEFKTHGATVDANYHIKSVKELAKYLEEISKKNFEDTERNLHGLIFAINNYAFRLKCRKEDIKKCDSERTLTSEEIKKEIDDCKQKISKCEKKISKYEKKCKRVKPKYKEVTEKYAEIEKEYKEIEKEYKNNKKYKEEYKKLDEKLSNYRKYKSYVEKLDDLQEIKDNFKHVPEAIAAIKDFIEGYETRMDVDYLKKIMEEYEEAKSNSGHTPKMLSDMLSNILSTINESIKNTEPWLKSQQTEVNDTVSEVKKDVNEVVKLKKEVN